MTPLFESFLFGFANSLHCACMCGPLALAFGGGLRQSLAYQGGRATAYLLVGCALGASGALVGTGRLGAPTATIAFVLAAGLVVLALGGERGALKVPGLSGVVRRVTAAGRALPPTSRAAVLGAVTPLLPCGLLWSAFAAAALAGSAAAGGQVMLGFALGAAPLLLLTQVRSQRLAARFSPRALFFVQRLAMLLAAAVLVWRGIVTAAGDSCCS